jgi:hypothetical protein
MCLRRVVLSADLPLEGSRRGWRNLSLRSSLPKPLTHLITTNQNKFPAIVNKEIIPRPETTRAPLRYKVHPTPPTATANMASPPAIEDQARLLEDALGVVRQQANLMRKCLETPGKLMDALKCG